jgi:heterodisulfide reductase subunit C
MFNNTSFLFKIPSKGMQKGTACPKKLGPVLIFDFSRRFVTKYGLQSTGMDMEKNNTQKQVYDRGVKKHRAVSARQKGIGSWSCS